MKRKKSIAMALILTMFVITLASILSGCVNHLEDEVIIGDFVCQEWSDGTISIKDLSEEGKKKKYIVVPAKLGGRIVDMLGYKNAIFSPGKSNWHSENLEKIYMNNNKAFFLNGLLDDCPKVKKYILIQTHKKGFDHISPLNITTYFKAEYYLNHMGGDENLIYFENGVLCWRGADISYYYNYEESPNDGYYWIDDVEDGELIDFIPQDPERDGYKFQGWYKEQECINKWDFNKDRIIKASVDEPYYENKLFAKWAKE